MRLYINTDRNEKTGWEGYDYVVNRLSAGAVEHSKEGWNWSASGEAKFSLDGSKMEIAIPRSALGVADGKAFEIEFKWVDNSQTDGDIYDFYLSGDAAPLGRFNYLYKAK